MPEHGRAPFSGAETRFLRELLRAKVEFMVVGLSAAALQGAPVVTQDIDLWFRDLDDPRLRTAVKRAGAGFMPPIDLHPPMLLGKGVELFDIVTHMHGLGSFAEERRHALVIPIEGLKVPVLSLDRVLASKRALDRPKDRLYLRVLAATMKAVEFHRAHARGRPRAGKIRK